MERLSHITLCTTVATLVCCLLLGCDADDDRVDQNLPWAAPSQDTGDDGPQVVALVNDREITADEVERRLDRIGELYRLSQRPFDDQARAQRREEVIHRLVERELLRAHIADQDIQIDDEKVEEMVRQRVERDFRSQEAFQRFLKAEQISQADFHERVREKMTIDALLAERVDAEAIPEEQLHDYYERISRRHPADERIHASTWAIELGPGADGDTREKWRETVEKVLSKVDEPNAISAHLDHSQLSIKADRTRWLEPRHLPPEAVDLLFDDQAPTNAAHLVDTPQGFELFWIHDRREAGVRDFDEVRDQLYERARRSRLQQERRELIEELHRQAQIEILLPDVTLEAFEARN